MTRGRLPWLMWEGIGKLTGVTRAILSLSLILLGTPSGPVENCPKTDDVARGEDWADRLTEQEAADVRSCLLRPLCICHKWDAPFPVRQIALSEEMLYLHQRKRLALLELLLDRTKKGNAWEATNAATIAIALDEGADSPSAISSYFSNGSDYAKAFPFDKEVRRGGPTVREQLIQRVEELLNKDR